MIELLVRFKYLSDFYIFAAATAICILWVYCGQKKRITGLWPFVALNFVLFIAWGFLSPLNHDDVAFLHFAWLISRGQVPFTGFWEHHSPFLPVLMAPLMKFVPRSAAVFDIARVFSGCVFVINIALGWRISRQVWQDKARLSVYLLAVSGACVFAQYLILRPDVFMILFVLAGVSICLEIPRKGVVTSLLSGIAFGLAMAFVTKQYLIVVLPVIAACLGEKRVRGAKIAAYAAGFCVGIAPLVSYLYGAGILRDFFYWAVSFNARALRIYVNFPMIFVAAGIGGGVFLIRRYRAAQNIPAALLLCALVLSTVSSFTRVSEQDGLLYYLGLWYFLCAVAVSGIGLTEMLGKVVGSWKRAVISGIVLGILLSPNLALVWKYRRGEYVKDKAAAEILMKYTRDGSGVVILPMHPVFTVDATRLYSEWQFYFTTKFPLVLDDVRRNAIAQRIISLRPAVVMCRSDRRDFILELYQRKLISSQEYKELVSFLMQNYRQQQIGDNTYYILKTL